MFAKPFADFYRIPDYEVIKSYLKALSTKFLGAIKLTRVFVRYHHRPNRVRGSIHNKHNITRHLFAIVSP